MAILVDQTTPTPTPILQKKKKQKGIVWPLELVRPPSIWPKGWSDHPLRYFVNIF
jgi:hypothetical protein